MSQGINDLAIPLLTSLIERGSWKTCRYLGALIGVRSYHRNSKGRDVIVQNLHISFPGISHTRARRIALRARQSELMGLFELLHLRTVSLSQLPQYVEIEGLEHFQCALSYGHGAVLNTAHFGSYNLMGAMLSQHFPFTVVSNPYPSAVTQGLVASARQRAGMHILAPKGGARPSLSALRSNHILGMFVDLPGTHRDPFLSILNHTGPRFSVASRLALTTGAPLIPAFAVRRKPWLSNGRIVIKVRPPLWLKAPIHNQAQHQTELLRGTRYVTEAIEEIVRQHPDEWHCWTVPAYI